VVLNSTSDRPWWQYFCCMVGANREFVRRHPVATKRVIRALMKANDVCAVAPERAAGLIVGKGETTSYESALQTMQDLPYGKWREYDPEDTVRFYALRLHEAGMIKSSPQKIIAQGTDARRVVSGIEPSGTFSRESAFPWQSLSPRGATTPHIAQSHGRLYVMSLELDGMSAMTSTCRGVS
jgi:hypothetical protein